MYFKKTTAILFALCLVFQVFAQRNEGANYNPNYKYSIQELQSDFIILRWVLEKAHPGLYWYTPKEKLNAQMDSTFNLLNRQMTEREFYQLLAPIFANIHCGHTILDPSYFYQNLGKRFPFDLKIENEKVFIRYDYTENKTIPIGSELLSINGQSMQDILQKMYPAISSDALHLQGKLQALEDDFQNLYDLLIAQPDTFALEYVAYSTEERKKVFVPAQDSDFLRTYDKRYFEEIRQSKPLEFNILANGIALLNIRSFLPLDLKYARQKFSKFMKSAFQTIQSNDIKHLIIDLRQNGGGEMLYANELYSYLTDKPYRFLNRIEVSSDKKLSLLRTSELSKTTIHNPKHVALTDSGYIVKSSYYQFLETQQPKKNNYQGKVYILIGKNSFSAASLFASLAYTYKRAAFIGEETGGGANGLNGGDFIDMTLPNTNLVIEVPLEKWVRIIPNYPYKNRGVVPHHIIQNTIADEINQKDKVMEFTLELIRKEK